MTLLFKGKAARSCELAPSDERQPIGAFPPESVDDEQSGKGLSAEYELRTSDGTGSSHETQPCWKVRVNLYGHLITRQIWRDGESWHSEEREPEEVKEVIWPTWPGGSDDHLRSPGVPLADLQDYWSTAGNRLRDSAKWMAAVLGAALAAVIGTSPLASMRGHRPSWIAVGLGLTGVILLGVTLFLIVQVMRPQSVSYTDIQRSKKRTDGRRTTFTDGGRKTRFTSGSRSWNRSRTCTCHAASGASPACANP